MPTDCHRRALVAIGATLAIAATLLSPSARAACALTTNAPANSTAAYKEREKRCEGIYTRAVLGSAQLILRGFHLRSPDFDLPLPDRLTVEVAGISDHAIPGTLVAKSMRPRHYYQMDTDAIDQAGQFTWDTEILKHRDVAIESTELAVLYCEPDCKTDEPRKHWPVHVRESGTESSRKAIPYLIVEAESEIVEIFLTVTSQRSGTQVDYQELKRRSYPADTPIKIRIVAPESGEYAVSLTSVSRAGASGRLDMIAVLPAEAFDNNVK